MTTAFIGLSTVGKIAFLSSKAYAVTPDYLLDHQLDQEFGESPLVADLDQAEQKESVEHSAALADVSAPDRIDLIEFSPGPADPTTSVHALESPDELSLPEPDRAYSLVAELSAPIEFSPRRPDPTTWPN